MIKETNKENLEKADVIPDNLYYYNAVNDAVSIVEQEAGMKYTFRSEKELQEVIQACAGIQYTLGHSSFVTSMNIYVGVFDDDCRRMTESLQKTLFQNS